MDDHFQYSEAEIDSSHAQSVFNLAKTLFDYGQFERVLAILDLADWIADDISGVVSLRVRSLYKLGQLNDAADICLMEPEEIEEQLASEILLACNRDNSEAWDQL